MALIAEGKKKNANFAGLMAAWRDSWTGKRGLERCKSARGEFLLRSEVALLDRKLREVKEGVSGALLTFFLGLSIADH